MGISVKKKIGWVLHSHLISPQIQASLELLRELPSQSILQGVEAQVQRGETSKHELIGLARQLESASGEDFFYEFDQGIIFFLPPEINREWSQDDSIIDCYLTPENEYTTTKIKALHGSIYPYSWREWYLLGTNRILSLDEIQELKFDSDKFQQLKNELGFSADNLSQVCGMLPPPVLLEVLKIAQVPLSLVYPAIVSFST